MKVSAKGNSRFLAQDDVPEEGFTAIVKDVRVEALKSNRGDEDKYVLYFTAGKPMVFNVVNRQTVIASYGDDSDNWLENRLKSTSIRTSTWGESAPAASA